MSTDRLHDILDEMVAMRRLADELCAEAIKFHPRKAGDHVNTENSGQGVIVHVSCKLAMDQSHYQLLLTEHIARLSTAGRPLLKRLTRSYVLAEEWLNRGAPRRHPSTERRMLTRPAPTHTEI